ncbi:MAG: DNA helicase RecQ [Deltaproteobacteria bacterium]|nr:DNA helicase RecQ [Deltaproteobacteria bacterium]
MNAPNSPLGILKNVFGYDSFRLNQAKIIENILAGRDTLAIMPTGGGKSLCYQVPALIFPGITVVISPLISLMHDQVEQLLDAGVNAVMLNSAIDAETYRVNMAQVIRKQARLLYMAPETMLQPGILDFLSQVQVSCITIDEAHCISEWGHEFRPEYRQLAKLRQRFPDAVCVALTATATPRVRDDIRQSLSFGKSDEFVSSFDRPNLFLEVVLRQKGIYQVLDMAEKHLGESGIVYCASRKQVDRVCEQLCANGVKAVPYHAGMPDDERARNQEKFRMDEVDVIVATIAFGMGINKPDVRYVVHFELPKNIESYYQQIGRAGRDGLDADCLLLFSYADIAKVNFFIEQMATSEQRLARVHLNQLVHYCESALCRRILLMAYFGESVESPHCDTCDNCRRRHQPMVDLTQAAQKFMSCMYRTGERFGASHVADVLRGSQAQKVVDLGHHRVSTFGIGAERSKEEWLFISGLLLQNKLISQNEHGGLFLTAQARPVLTGKQLFECQVSPIMENRRKRTTGMGAAKKGVVHDHTLRNAPVFEKLRNLRTKLARERGVPPYVVFSDKTLVEMANKQPQTDTELLAVSGVGEAKLKQYGTQFLRVLQKNE